MSIFVVQSTSFPTFLERLQLPKHHSVSFMVKPGIQYNLNLIKIELQLIGFSSAINKQTCG